MLVGRRRYERNLAAAGTGSTQQQTIGYKIVSDEKRCCGGRTHINYKKVLPLSVTRALGRSFRVLAGESYVIFNSDLEQALTWQR